MPIPPQIRKQFYSGPDYQARRDRVKQRAANCCEQCGVPNNIDVDRANGGWWLEIKFKPGLTGAVIRWRDEHGKHVVPNSAKEPKVRRVRIVLALCHLNNTPGDDRDENLAFLCQWCHLHHDLPLHLVHARETRKTRKDARRPLLTAIEASA